MAQKIKTLGGNIKATTSGDDVIIDGFITTTDPDDDNDIMLPKGARLGRFKKNPMMLYNHDQDYPIGKAELIEVTDKGIRVKAKLSNSTVEAVTWVRDLVKEGILKTFSIGFDVFNESKNSLGFNEISDWQLNEFSIVTLPMNTAAEFSLAKTKGKAMSKQKNYKSAKLLTMRTKGAYVAARIWNAIYDLCESEDSWCFKKDPQALCQQMVLSIVEAAKVDEKAVWDLFHADVTEMPAPVLNAAASFLKIDPAELIALATADAAKENSGKIEETEEGENVAPASVENDSESGCKPTGGKTPSAKENVVSEGTSEKKALPVDNVNAPASETKPVTDQSQENIPPAKDPAPEVKELPMTVQSIIVSKEKFTKEEAIKWITEHNYSAEVDETDSSFRFRQRDPNEFDAQSFKTINFTDGIDAVVGQLKEGQKEAEKGFHNLAMKKVSEHKKSKTATVDACADIMMSLNATRNHAYDWEFVIKALQDGATEEPMTQQVTAPKATETNPTDFGSPMLDLMKSQLALTGELVSQIKMLNETCAKMVAAPMPIEQDNSQTVGTKGMASEVEERIARTRAKLKSFDIV
jgi:HK97 family phage prohead protease